MIVVLDIMKNLILVTPVTSNVKNVLLQLLIPPVNVLPVKLVP